MSMHIVEQDPYLTPYLAVLQHRQDRFEHRMEEVCREYRSLQKFANWHMELGFQFHDKKVIYRDWLPQILSASIVGDFNHWDTEQHVLKRIMGDIWEVEIPYKDFPKSNPHEQKLKIRIQAADGRTIDRIPAMIRYCYQDPISFEFYGKLWCPKKPYEWKYQAPKQPKQLLIYEAHIGMAQEKEGVGTYAEFKKNILPRIAKGNYNAIQLMGIQEHPYYGSFGYQVSSYFAPSSRFGNPEDLKSLIDAAHKLGLLVILDLVHSHAVKNVLDGLSEYNGTDYQYFHGGGRGSHSLWDSRLFQYGKTEVQRFLLSNIAYWLEEFCFDGFRFDGVTSMLYLHHGHYKQFNHYDMYFNDEVDEDAILYLQLANHLTHKISKNALTIAEDISGMPGLCRPIEDGGIGFDYRMHMGVADFWVKILKEYKDENWPLDTIYHELTTGRIGEKKICYAESHDQAMVGDKTLAFQLMDKEMYTHMSKSTPSLLIDRGICLLKMIRFLTVSLGGNGYLNFMGNEFGHPEWIDFPREGNNNSYLYARRQWSLVDDATLRYGDLAKFDREMLNLFGQESNITKVLPSLINLDKENNVLIFSRGDYIWFFNFHPERSIKDYQFGVDKKGDYRVIFETDSLQYSGFGRIDTQYIYKSERKPMHGHPCSLTIYTPNRAAFLLKRGLK